MTNYPALCAKVTASFSVLSDTINSVKASIIEQQRQRKHQDVAQSAQKNSSGGSEVVDFIVQLQKFESEKLNLTAALHLERLRLRNAKLEATGEGSGSLGDDNRTVDLLEDGVRTLRGKIASAIESTNEVLEELRCIATDES